MSFSKHYPLETHHVETEIETILERPGEIGLMAGVKMEGAVPSVFPFHWFLQNTLCLVRNVWLLAPFGCYHNDNSKKEPRNVGRPVLWRPEFCFVGWRRFRVLAALFFPCKVNGFCCCSMFCLQICHASGVQVCSIARNVKGRFPMFGKAACLVSSRFQMKV